METLRVVGEFKPLSTFQLFQPLQSPTVGRGVDPGFDIRRVSWHRSCVPLPPLFLQGRVPTPIRPRGPTPGITGSISGQVNWADPLWSEDTSPPKQYTTKMGHFPPTKLKDKNAPFPQPIDPKCHLGHFWGGGTMKIAKIFLCKAPEGKSVHSGLW